MATMETVQSSADNTDREDVHSPATSPLLAPSDSGQKFEDANEDNDPSKGDSSHDTQPSSGSETTTNVTPPTTHDENLHPDVRNSNASSNPPKSEPSSDSVVVDEATASRPISEQPLDEATTSRPTSEQPLDEALPSRPPSGQPIPAVLTTEPVSDGQPPEPPAKPPRPSRFQGFSAALPSVPWGPPPPPKKAPEPRAPSPQPPQPATFGRKVTTPFGWLSRATSSTPKELKSPVLPSRSALDTRRNTAASASTLGSNPDLMLKALEEAQDGSSRHHSRASLREQFKMLRLREEAGVTNFDGPDNGEGGALAGLIGRSASLGVGIATPEALARMRMSFLRLYCHPLHQSLKHCPSTQTSHRARSRAYPLALPTQQPQSIGISGRMSSTRALKPWLEQARKSSPKPLVVASLRPFAMSSGKSLQAARMKISRQYIGTFARETTIKKSRMLLPSLPY